MKMVVVAQTPVVSNCAKTLISRKNYLNDSAKLMQELLHSIEFACDGLKKALVTKNAVKEFEKVLTSISARSVSK